MVSERNCNHSRLFVQDGTVAKHIEPHLYLGRQEAEHIRSSMVAYYKELSAHGVPTPTEYVVKVSGAIRKFKVMEVATNMGTDCEVIFRQSGLSQDIVARILRAIAGVLEAKELSIDPHPANWCIKGDAIAFVDFHPARLRHNGEYLVGFPQPQVQKDVNYSRRRYYSPLGIIRLLRFNLVRLCGPGAEELLMRAMKSVLPVALTNRIQKDLLALPDQQIAKTDLAELLDPLGIWNIDDLRDIAMRVGFLARREGNFLNEVLRLTTIDFRVPLQIRRERLVQAKRLILSGM